eukprot:m.49512 g.49512  ORF g.49512 m.49512 type:complete len:51 (-) comp6484_c0_seq1:34-186(-)
MSCTLLCSMKKLLKPEKNQKYVDLTLTLASPDGTEAEGPAVRYYFKPPKA